MLSYRNLMIVWLLIGGLLTFEHVSLNYFPALSVLKNLQDLGLLDKALELTTAPGRPLSFYYGIIGFTTMLCTNFYIMRKRISFLKGLGNLRNWLDVHIFFGVVGSTFIVFHSDFKVRGIVAISFWSMVVAVVSGFLGRYFYVNASRLKKEYRDLQEKAAGELKSKLPADKTSEILERAVAYRGVKKLDGNVGIIGIPVFLAQTMVGDIKGLLRVPVIADYAGTEIDQSLKEYGKLKRNEVYADTYCRLLSYWHTFHLPFTTFMWIAGVIHIISSFIFKV